MLGLATSQDRTNVNCILAAVNVGTKLLRSRRIVKMRVLQGYAALAVACAVNAAVLRKREALDPACTETVVSRHKVTVTEAPFVHSITTGRLYSTSCSCLADIGMNG